MLKLGFVSAMLADKSFDVEDRAFEDSEASVKTSILQSHNFVSQFMVL